MSCEKLFLNELRQRGYRLTSQREAVLLTLHEFAFPVSVDEIFNRVTQKNGDVELTTVYRTLDLLNSLGLVAIIDSGDKQRLYELVASNHPHLHLVCRVCGKISGMEFASFQPLVDQIKRQAHFSVDLGSITVQGTCLDCTESTSHEHTHE
jgi:Fur family ferric uptake transcriptional regulator